VISSRPFETEAVRVMGFATATIAPFDDDQIGTFLDLWVRALAPDEAAMEAVGEKVPEYRVPPGQALVAPKGMSFFAETEANDTPATANALPGTEAVVYGAIVPATDVDYYSFTANAGDYVSAATMTQFSNGGSTDTTLSIIASDGTTVLETDTDNGSFSSLSSAISGTSIPPQAPTTFLSTASAPRRPSIPTTCTSAS
jgi:hypothetical protein